jgi:hypothetical protein
MCSNRADEGIGRRDLLKFSASGIVALGFGGVSWHAHAAEGAATTLSPDEALAALKSGNDRYVSHPKLCSMDLAEQRHAVALNQATQDKKIKRRYDIFLRAKYFILMEGYNPRIHTLYFCPQLYRYDNERKLLPLQGEEIGQLIAQAAKAGVTERRPWYEPSEKLPERPPINNATLMSDFDTVVVEMPDMRNAAAGKQS